MASPAPWRLRVWGRTRLEPKVLNLDGKKPCFVMKLVQFYNSDLIKHWTIFKKYDFSL
jgi:hypothetical protein